MTTGRSDYSPKKGDQNGEGQEQEKKARRRRKLSWR
jgi:hypothetical protein